MTDLEKLWRQKYYDKCDELNEALAIGEELKTALIMAVSRTTEDPDHDWNTCNQPSCIMARKALALTPSDALKKLKAKHLRECADHFKELADLTKTMNTITVTEDGTCIVPLEAKRIIGELLSAEATIQAKANEIEKGEG
jgi:hypothetical protein